MSGYVYVLSNPRMPGLVKIGFTEGQPSERAIELSRPTGVPAPFDVEAFFPTDTPHADEQQIHALLAKCRDGRKEFFLIGVQAAITTCIDACSYESGYLGHWSRPGPKRPHLSRLRAMQQQLLTFSEAYRDRP